MNFGMTYAIPSTLDSTRERTVLGLSPEVHRPLRFRGRVKSDVLSIRLALQALGRVVWNDETWLSDQDYLWRVLDPVITVHPDRVFFEAFSQDLSSYGLVIVDRARFETEGEVVCGTTNVDFTAWLAAALDEMRTSRVTYFAVEPQGFEVATRGAGGRYEPKVDVPDTWVRAFLSLQASMAMPGTRLAVRPVDLLAAVRHLAFTKAKMSPRGIRYEFEPGRDARLVLEPWEHVVPLRGASHAYAEPHTIRVWGRRRLRLLEGLLPYADGVEVFLKGRAMPHFYAVHLPGATFVLGLSGWTANNFSDGGGLDLLAASDAPEDLIARAIDALRSRVTGTTDDVAKALGVEPSLAARALVRACRRGRCLFDVARREWRHRELFAEPLDEVDVFPPDARLLAAQGLVASDAVTVDQAAIRETRKRKRLKTPDGPVERDVVYRDWQVTGSVKDSAVYKTEVVQNDEDRVIFGTCTCEWFRVNLLARGPCAHMLALTQVARPLRAEAATSVAADPALRVPVKLPRDVVTDDDLADDEPEDEGDGTV